MRIEDVRVIKKDNTKEVFNVQKVVIAVNKSAYRALVTFTEEEIAFICRFVEEKVLELNKPEVHISEMHNVVEGALEQTNPAVAKSYRDYRNYKQDFVQMLDEVYKKSQSIMYIGDKENSNTDSALVSTKRSLVFNELNKSLYQKFFMTTEELQACRDGYIYIHDMSARRDTMNCCLFDVQNVLKGGFEMGNLWYNEPKTLDVAFDVIGDIVLSAASQQYDHVLHQRQQLLHGSMLAGGSAGGAVGIAAMGMGMGLVVVMQVLVAVGMFVVMGVGMLMLMGMGDAVVGVLMGVSMGMLVVVMAAAVFVVDVHRDLLVSFQYILY